MHMLLRTNFHNVHIWCDVFGAIQRTCFAAQVRKVNLKETTTKAATIAGRNSVLRDTNATWELVQHKALVSDL